MSVFDNRVFSFYNSSECVQNSDVMMKNNRLWAIFAIFIHKKACTGGPYRTGHAYRVCLTVSVFPVVEVARVCKILM